MYKFFKMNGLGNSFIFFDEAQQDFSSLKNAEIIKTLCSPGNGIGADGVVFVEPPKDATKNSCYMRIYNEDGSEAEMCGNALRCVAHLFIGQRVSRDELRIETGSGVKQVSLAYKTDETGFYRAEIGVAELDLVKTGELLPLNDREVIKVDDKVFEPFYVNVGNPHGVLFFDDMPDLEFIERVGNVIETHKNHPRRINVEFVKVLKRDLCEINIWERGCGITKACGTGACAVVAAGIKKGVFDSKVRVKMPGGVLDIEQDSRGLLHMTGPVQEVVYGHLSGLFLEHLISLTK